MSKEEEAILADSEALFEQLANSACERAERSYNRGDRSAILEAMFACATSGVLLPSWVKDAFVQAYLETKVGPPLHRSWMTSLASRTQTQSTSTWTQNSRPASFSV
jgi:type VI protein secretion system component VasK